MKRLSKKVEQSPKDCVKLSIIGCGAVVQERYLPASKLIPNIEILYVIDTNIKTAEEVARRFRVPNYTNDYQAIFGKVDAAVIATPPKYHAQIAIDCLNHGIHVLCEKPLAISSKEAQRIVRISMNTKKNLAIGMNRRLCPSSKLAKDLLTHDFIGELSRFEVEEGSEFNWPLQSLHLFKKEEAGGGVLADVGPHLFDLLLWLISKDVKIISCKDDNLGGVEANVQIELELKYNSKKIPGTIEISRTRKLRNIIRIFGERGYIDIPTLGGEAIYFYPKINTGKRIEIRYGDNPKRGRVEEFGEELLHFRDSILNEKVYYVKGIEAIPVVECIEECYKIRGSINKMWKNNNFDYKFLRKIKGNNRKLKILITGASGFIGNHLAERLVINENVHVKALIHKLSNPGVARLARLPIEIIQGDILDLSSLLDITRDCDVIIHCAYGKRKVTVKGTENVLKAVLLNKINKVIHLSTSVVNGRNPRVDLIDESSSFKNDGDIYNKSKIEAEKIIWKYYKKYKLPVIVLRPTCVYGPYGRMWTIRPIKEIKSGSITLVNGGNGIANIVYIDNLIDAILLAIKKKDVVGEAFIVNDEEYITWEDFYKVYANMLSDNIELNEINLHDISSINKVRRRDSFYRSIAFPLNFLKSIVKSPEVHGEIKKVPWVRSLASKIPERIKNRIKCWINMNKNINSLTIENLSNIDSELPQIPSRDLMKLYISNTRFSNIKLKHILGWEQRVKFDEAMRLIEEYLKYQRLI